MSISVRHAAALSLLASLATPGMAQDAPTYEQLQAIAAQRFPQEVLVGDLIGRQVLRHLESQPTIGFVSDVVERVDNRIFVIIDLGGRFAWSRRSVAVPVEALALNGQYLEVNAYSPQQLAALPAFSAKDERPVSRDAKLSVALSKPAH